MSQVPERRGPDRQVRFGRILGLFFCVAGFVAIGFGWNGSARTAFVDSQFPYLISGGTGGLALVLLGIGLLLMAQIRDERMKLGDQFREAAAAMSKAVSAPTAAGPGGLVVVGKSTYHRQECRLVEGKADVDMVAVEVARLQGLSPCRVCDPPTGEGSNDAGGTDTKKTPAKKTPAKASGRG